MKRERSNTFLSGVLDGIAVALGYFSVSFSFGILAVTSGLSTLQATLMSLTNLTSAGQVAGVGILSASGGLIEMAVSQLIINIRYGLMSISLSQKTDSSVTLPARFLMAFGITDEIFGVAIGAPHEVGRRYYMGLMTLPIVGWTAGTLLGAVLGGIFPEILTASLSIGIFGMFVSIVLPRAKHNSTILVCSLIACALSAIFYYVPVLSNHISSGFATIIAAVVSALVGALFLPYRKEEENA